MDLDAPSYRCGGSSSTNTHNDGWKSQHQSEHHPYPYQYGNRNRRSSSSLSFRSSRSGRSRSRLSHAFSKRRYRSRSGERRGFGEGKAICRTSSKERRIRRESEYQTGYGGRNDRRNDRSIDSRSNRDVGFKKVRRSSSLDSGSKGLVGDSKFRQRERSRSRRESVDSRSRKRMRKKDENKEKSESLSRDYEKRQTGQKDTQNKESNSQNKGSSSQNKGRYGRSISRSNKEGSRNPYLGKTSCGTNNKQQESKATTANKKSSECRPDLDQKSSTHQQLINNNHPVKNEAAGIAQRNSQPASPPIPEPPPPPPEPSDMHHSPPSPPRRQPKQQKQRDDHLLTELPPIRQEQVGGNTRWSTNPLDAERKNGSEPNNSSDKIKNVNCNSTNHMMASSHNNDHHHNHYDHQGVCHLPNTSRFSVAPPSSATNVFPSITDNDKGLGSVVGESPTRYLDLPLGGNGIVLPLPSTRQPMQHFEPAQEERFTGEQTPESSHSVPSCDVPSCEIPSCDVSSPAGALMQTKIKGDAWTQIERLEKNRLCHHCCKNRWQHSQLPVCKKCQITLSPVNCQHCKEQFLQHRMLQQAAEYFARVICLPCARNVASYGLPKHCGYCSNLAAFGDNSCCDRCISFSSKYGLPERCSKCNSNAAFKREPEKMEKVDNLTLCFQCTINYKKDKYKSQKRQHQKTNHRFDKSSASTTVSLASLPAHINLLNGATDLVLNEKIEALKKELEKQKSLIENYKLQIAQCQQQLKKKDADLMNFAKEIEHENFLLKKDSEENRRKSIRDEQRIAQLTKEIAEAGRNREKEITKLIEANHTERDKFNDLIDSLKAENENLQEELEKKRSGLKEVKVASKEEQQQHERYKGITEKRVQKLSQKYLKTIEKHEERAKEKTRVISNLRREMNKLKTEQDRYQKLERQSLGLEEEEAREDSEGHGDDYGEGNVTKPRKTKDGKAKDWKTKEDTAIDMLSVEDAAIDLLSAAPSHLATGSYEKVTTDEREGKRKVNERESLIAVITEPTKKRRRTYSQEDKMMSESGVDNYQHGVEDDNIAPIKQCVRQEDDAGHEHDGNMNADGMTNIDVEDYRQNIEGTKSDHDDNNESHQQLEGATTTTTGDHNHGESADLDRDSSSIRSPNHEDGYHYSFGDTIMNDDCRDSQENSDLALKGQYTNNQLHGQLHAQLDDLPGVDEDENGSTESECDEP